MALSQFTLFTKRFLQTNKKKLVKVNKLTVKVNEQKCCEVSELFLIC